MCAVLISVGTSAILVEVFSNFPQSLQKNISIIPLFFRQGILIVQASRSHWVRHIPGWW